MGPGGASRENLPAGTLICDSHPAVRVLALASAAIDQLEPAYASEGYEMLSPLTVLWFRVRITLCLSVFKYLLCL